MFSSSIHTLPSCHDYVGAARTYTCALSANPKIKPMWPEGTRPLDDYRKTHYAVIKDGDKYAFRLYNTHIVTWGPTTCEIDITYDSASTHDFARHYAPAGISFPKYRGQQCICTRDGLMNHSSRVVLHQVGYEWRFVSEVRKPTKKVLVPDIRWQVEKELKPLLDYIRAIWAISGNTGYHPWVGQPVDKEDANGTALERAVKGAILTSRRYLHHVYPPHVYPPVTASILIAEIRKKAFEDAKAYIDIPYDMEVPRKT